MQVCDVNQGLLSVSKATASGNRLGFDEAGSYVESNRGAEKTRLKQTHAMPCAPSSCG